MLRRLPAEPLAGVATGTPAATLAGSFPVPAATQARPVPYPYWLGLS